jgi:thiol-disulfide isomerase/thioredoxin
MVLMLGLPAATAAEPPGPLAELRVASWEETERVIKNNKGTIIVLDIWSTGCQPCVKEFPQLVELSNSGLRVMCISLNTNYIGIGKPRDEFDDVLKFLTRQNANQVHNLLSSDADEDLYKKIGIASIPVVQVYGRDGKLAKQFDNEKDEYGKDGFTYEKHVTPYVQKLVESK